MKYDTVIKSLDQDSWQKFHQLGSNLDKPQFFKDGEKVMIAPNLTYVNAGNDYITVLVEDKSCEDGFKVVFLEDITEIVIARNTLLSGQSATKGNDAKVIYSLWCEGKIEVFLNDDDSDIKRYKRDKKVFDKELEARNNKVAMRNLNQNGIDREALITVMTSLSDEDWERISKIRNIDKSDDTLVEKVKKGSKSIKDKITGDS